jgi:predicted ATP-grasp superfamily ATP-dependent carboligase
VFALIIIGAAVGLAANAFYFGVPHHEEVAVEATGAQRINVTGSSALVTVTPEWVAAKDTNLPRLLRALRERKVQKALLVLPNGASAGIVDVASGKAMGMATPAAR